MLIICLTGLLFVTLNLQHVQAYCWEPGKNPGFTGPPFVEQLDLSHVRVSWEGLITQRNCADQFLVKFWQTINPQAYVMTELLDVTTDSVVIMVTPNVSYQFQAVAREDKGPIGGVDWNKSPIAEFKTTSLTTTSGSAIEATTTVQTSHKVKPTKFTTPKLEAAPTAISEKEPKNNFPLSMELLAILVICMIGVLLIFIGVAYKLFCSKRGENETSPEEGGNEEREKLRSETT